MIYYMYCHFSICDMRCHGNGKILTFLSGLFLFSFSLSQWTIWHPCKIFLLVGEESYINWWPIKNTISFVTNLPKSDVMPSCTFSHGQAQYYQDLSWNDDKFYPVFTITDDYVRSFLTYYYRYYCSCIFYFSKRTIVKTRSSTNLTDVQNYMMIVKCWSSDNSDLALPVLSRTLLKFEELLSSKQRYAIVI